MSQSSTRSEIQRLLTQIAALKAHYEISALNDSAPEVNKTIEAAIGKLQERLKKMQEKLLGVSIE